MSENTINEGIDDLSSEKKQVILNVIRKIREKIEIDNPDLDESSKMELIKEKLYDQHSEMKDTSNEFQTNKVSLGNYDFTKLQNLNFAHANKLT